MQSKLDQIREAWTKGDKIAALRITSRFFDRSPETQTFKRGWDAANNPGFYRQIGRDPDALTRDAIDALAKKFSLPR